MRDYKSRIVRSLTGTRQRNNNIVDELFSFLFFLLLFRYYVFLHLQKKEREGRRRKASNKRSTRRRLRTKVADVVDCSTSIFRFIARLITANFGDLDRGYIRIYNCGISRNTVDKSP